MIGLIIENKSDLFVIKRIDLQKEENIKNKIFTAKIRGKLKKDGLSPVVGDVVECEMLDEDSKEIIINSIQERKNIIKRPKIANITQLILVLSIDLPKPDLLMLDKQLIFAEWKNIKPIIVFNKTDLEKNNEIAEIYQIYKNIGYNVIKTSAKEGQGIEKLKKVLKNNINVFSGNSGVGKSSLTNQIFQKELTGEGQISKKNKRGKNTTTSTKLYEISENTYIADTPGFSTFDIKEIPKEELADLFIEFRPYLSRCEYTDCKHIKELNCGIKKAIEEGKISQQRYDTFIKLYQQ